MAVDMINGLAIHFEHHGNAGTPIVFVHGYLGAKEDWKDQVRAFERDHRVLIFDNRGHGASEAPPDEAAYKVEHLAADTEALIDGIGWLDFHLVGHSIGGAVAQEIALRHGSRVRSLILCDTTDWFGDHDQPGGSAPYLPPTLAESTARRVEGMSNAALRGTWLGLLRWQGTRNRAQAIGCPTLIVHGARDASRIVEGSERLHALIPNAHIVVIRGAGHSPHRECPREFNAAVKTFLDTNGR
jgi:pimeloyl-ACP methyl ester carboxylesterase